MTHSVILERLLDFCWNDAERKAAVIAEYLAGFGEAASSETLRNSSNRVLWLRVLYEGLRWHHEIQALDPGCEHATRLRVDQTPGTVDGRAPQFVSGTDGGGRYSLPPLRTVRSQDRTRTLRRRQ